jgi:hypothetical protein
MQRAKEGKEKRISKQSDIPSAKIDWKSRQIPYERAPFRRNTCWKYCFKLRVRILYGK